MKFSFIKTILVMASLFAGLVLFATSNEARAAAEVGQTAPDFEAVDTNGNDFKLSDHKGEIVVLEWTNHLCPFVVKHYDSGNMQATQKAAMDQGVKWITIVSSAPGKQGHVTAEEANTLVEEKGATISAKILDESGEIGKAYGAQTTPHMYVIDEEGTLVYAGAIDSNASPNPDTIEGATNYVLAALDSLKAGTEIETTQSQPYGCSVKY